jgi:hypothetical protein
MSAIDKILNKAREIFRGLLSCMYGHLVSTGKHLSWPYHMHNLMPVESRECSHTCFYWNSSATNYPCKTCAHERLVYLARQCNIPADIGTLLEYHPMGLLTAYGGTGNYHLLNISPIGGAADLRGEDSNVTAHVSSMSFELYRWPPANGTASSVLGTTTSGMAIPNLEPAPVTPVAITTRAQVIARAIRKELEANG